MIGCVAFDVDDVWCQPPVQLLARHDDLAQSTSAVHFPLGVVAEMSYVGDIFVAILFDLHLFDGVCPWVEVDLAALSVEREIGDFDKAAGVQANLGHPSDDAGVGDPRIEVLELVQIFVSANSARTPSTNIRTWSLTGN